jgi:hypothetical protein
MIGAPPKLFSSIIELLQLNSEEVVQIIVLRRFVGAPNGYPFAALVDPVLGQLPMSGLRAPTTRMGWPGGAFL